MTDDVLMRDASGADFDTILALNAESVHYTSPLDHARLSLLHAQAAYHRVIVIDGVVVAFLLVMREGADYDSVNYRWFAQRYPEFLYVDRIVIDAAQRGRQLGAALYADLIVFARKANAATIACEFDIVPPNPVSQAFHARFGFLEVGTQWLAGGSKQVSLQTLAL